MFYDNATNAAPGKEERKPTVSAYDHEGEAGDHEVIKGVVDAHGPALSHEHRPDGDNEMVVSHHEDGHEHNSYGHPTFAHAHKHTAIAHGEVKA